MFCQSCGAELPRGDAFCTRCGAAANSGAARPPLPGLVGFSDRCSHPEILAAAKKSRKSAVGCMWVLVLAALVGFPVAGLLMDSFPLGEAVIVGVCIALVMLAVGLLALKGAKQPMWEGVVTGKTTRKRHEQRGDTSTSYTEFRVTITTATGKKKKIIEKNSGRIMYDYLAVGDRVRYHPRFGTYEKFDKSKDRTIYCNVCMAANPVQSDRCKRCGNLLFK